jgi:hypothetical protein
MGQDDISDAICFRAVRQAIKFQKNHSGNAQTLTNDKFAEVSVFRDQDAAFRIGHLNYVLVRNSLPGLCNGDDIVAVSPESFDNLA